MMAHVVEDKLEMILIIRIMEIFGHYRAISMSEDLLMEPGRLQTVSAYQSRTTRAFTPTFQNTVLQDMFAGLIMNTSKVKGLTTAASTVIWERFQYARLVHAATDLLCFLLALTMEAKTCTPILQLLQSQAAQLYFRLM